MLEKAILYDFHFFLSRSDSLVNFRYFQALSYRNLDCLFPPLSNLETYLGPYQILWWKLLRKYYSTRNSFIKTYFIGVWEDPKLMFVDIGHILMKYFFLSPGVTVKILKLTKEIWHHYINFRHHIQRFCFY